MRKSDTICQAGSQAADSTYETLFQREMLDLLCRPALFLT